MLNLEVNLTRPYQTFQGLDVWWAPTSAYKQPLAAGNYDTLVVTWIVLYLNDFTRRINFQVLR